MKLWLDDICPAPNGYIRCWSSKEAIDSILARELLDGTTGGFGIEDNIIRPFELIDISYCVDSNELYEWLAKNDKNYPIIIHNLSTIKLPAYDRRDAVQIIKDYGFLDETPDICMMTHKLFAKNGHMYMCDGWCDLNKDRYYDNVLMHRVK